MNFYFLVATVSLALQIGVIALLMIGFEFKLRLRFRLHGSFMLTAVVVHLITIGVVMIPAFIAIITEKSPILISSFAPFHAVFGTITAVLGVWIVGSWRLRRSTKFCAPKKIHACHSHTLVNYFILGHNFLFHFKLGIPVWLTL